MDAQYVKDTHPTKIELMCECCGRSFLINVGDKRVAWCSSECRSRIVKGKPKPKERVKSVRELVDAYYDGEDEE